MIARGNAHLARMVHTTKRTGSWARGSQGQRWQPPCIPSRSPMTPQLSGHPVPKTEGGPTHKCKRCTAFTPPYRATVLAYIDTFWITGVDCLLATALLFFAKKSKSGQAPPPASTGDRLEERSRSTAAGHPRSRGHAWPDSSMRTAFAVLPLRPDSPIAAPQRPGNPT